MTAQKQPSVPDDPFELGPFFFTMGVGLIAFIGWRLSHYHLMTPKHGLGYWLGIGGGLLMLALLYYPVHKRMSHAERKSKLRTWFKFHMIMGVLGPLLILYHCNYRLGDLNSNIALMTMLVVAISGIFGRYFYIRIHRGLYGEKETLNDMQNRLKSDNENLAIVLKQYPDLLKEISDFVDVYTKPGGKTVSSTLFHILKVSRRVKRMRHQIFLRTQKAVRLHAKEMHWSAHETKAAIKSINKSTKNIMNMVLKVSQFNFYERLFSLWHVAHVPLFFIMLTAIVVHIVAAHLY